MKKIILAALIALSAVVFDLMPYDIQQKAIVAYNDIVTDTRSEFVYDGVCEAHRHNLGVLL